MKKIAVISGIFIAVLFALNIFLRSIYIVPIITYHSIDTKSDEAYKLLVVSPRDFKRQMDFLKCNKYNVISLDGLADILSSKKAIPRKTICITFDDGYENNYEYAYPILKNLKMPATIFVITNLINKPNYLTSAQIREMADNGIYIGSHTKSHFWLGAKDIDMDKAKEEIFDSKKILEGIILRPVTFFCYPSGGFTNDTRQLVIDAGYRGATGTHPGKKYLNDDIYALKRLRIGHQCDNLFIFWFETTGYYRWLKEHAHRYKERKSTQD